jgi:hypothetical protein
MSRTQSRASFEQYYADDDPTGAWRRLLRSVPGYNEVTAFPYDEYLRQRMGVRDELKRRIQLLSRQVDFLEEFFTSGDGYLLRAGATQDEKRLP